MKIPPFRVLRNRVVRRGGGDWASLSLGIPLNNIVRDDKRRMYGSQEHRMYNTETMYFSFYFFIF
jgi:hypothetical protein